MKMIFLKQIHTKTNALIKIIGRHSVYLVSLNTKSFELQLIQSLMLMAHKPVKDLRLSFLQKI